VEEQGKPRITAEEVAALVRERDPDGKTLAVIVRTWKGNVVTAEDRFDLKPPQTQTNTA
jgi:hypothetical protein